MNNYHIYEEVGRGKNSVVYKGRMKKTIEYVAVKSVDRNRRKKMMEEVAIFEKIKNHVIGQNKEKTENLRWHPNILKFYNWYETRNHFWIILEFCSGSDLYSLIEQDKALQEDSVKQLAYELVEGLSYLHSLGIIYCDLKPSNLLMNEYNNLKFSDFGLAKKIEDLSNILGKTDAEQRTANHQNSSGKNKAGTPYYMAPELFQDEGVYSYQSDFWSLGCIMIEMATGKPPFFTNSLQELIQQIVNVEVSPLSNFSNEFNDIIKIILQKDPVKRCNWDELKNHPWWKTPYVSKKKTPIGNSKFEQMTKKTYTFTKRIYEPQLQFEKYLQNVRKIDPQDYYQMKQLHSNSLSQAISNAGQGVDVMRISYNVMKNMKQEEETEAQNKQNKTKQGEKQDAQPSTPGPEDGYNNRNSKLNKLNRIDSGFMNNEPSDEQKKGIFHEEIDFYNKDTNKKDTGVMAATIAKQPQITSLDNNDYNLGRNTKMVLDFSNQDNNDAIPTEEVNKPPTSGNKSKSTSPNVPGGIQGSDSKAAGLVRVPPAIKQNNFFGSNKKENNEEQKQTAKINAFQVTPSPKNHHSKPLQYNLSNQKLDSNQKVQKQLFPSKQDSGKPDIPRKVSPMPPAHQRSGSKGKQQQQDKYVDPQQLQKQQIIPPQSIDRFALMNDQFDLDQFDENIQQYEPNKYQNFEQQQHTYEKPKWDYHKPLEEENSNNSLKMIKDMTMFSSPLSQAQIKQEIYQLVTYTVQIGPVQQQQQQQNPVAQDNIGVQSTGTFSSGKVSNVGESDANSQSTQAKTFGASNGSGSALSMAGNLPTQMKVPHKTIEQLIIHNSDTAVKPIVGNKEIETIVEQTYNQQHLKFVPWTSEQVLQNINTTEIESHLSDVYTSIASNTTINEKISTLQYFESIIVNSNVSNSLINSIFMALLKKMLEQIKNPQIKIRVCSVVGLLIRHSTMIDNELAEIDIASQLIDTLRDSNEKVRRRAIAALGEYMFYAATQLDDEMADPVWELSNDAINIIVESLDEIETDQIVRFYACKTLENICAQSTSAGHRFANLDTVKQVLKIYLMKKDPVKAQDESYIQWYDGIRISAAIALSHICKLNPQLFPDIFETITPSKFCETLIENNSQSRVQQAFITMLNLALHNIYYPHISSILLKEKMFLKALLKLLEHQQIVIRGKCILTFLLLFKLDFRWMTVVQQEIKFFNELDKLLKDNYKYVQCCLLCLADGIQEIVPTIFKTITEQLIIYVENSKLDSQNQKSNPLIEEADDSDLSNIEFIKDNNGVNEYGDFQEIMTSQLFHVTILLDLQINPLIRARVLSTPMLQSLAAMLDVCDINSFQGAQRFMNALLIISENLSSNYKALAILAQPVLSLLVPVLFNKLTNSQSLDVRFLSFKIYTDIMTQYISDPNFQLKQGQGDNGKQDLNQLQTQQNVSRLIDTTISNELIPRLMYILTSDQCQDPIPMFGLRLLSSIIDRSPSFFNQMNQSNDLLIAVASFYQVSHPRLNRHTLKVIQKWVESRQVGLNELESLSILKNTNLLVTSMLKNRQEWCLEIMLDILHDLLTQFNEIVKSNEEQIVYHIEEVFSNFEVCVKMLGLNFDISLVEKASQCLIQMLQLFAQSQLKKREIFFVESHFQYLMSAIKCDRQIIQKRVLKCIYWALIQNEYQIQLGKDKIQQLEVQMEQMINSRDRSIAQTSREVYKLLSQQKQAAVQREATNNNI